MSVAREATFDPRRIRAFQFTYRSLQPDGTVRLGYALDDLEFEERFELPPPTVRSSAQEGLLDLLHWVAGVSYYKAAIPKHLVCETGAPPPGTGRLLSALYSEGLAEFAVVNDLDDLPRPQFPRGVDLVPSSEPLSGHEPASGHAPTLAADQPQRILVPVGGGKDSCVAIEIARASGREVALFSVGDAKPIAATAGTAALPRYVATRKLDRRLIELNAEGALNGHIPITAIVSCVALLTAATQGFEVVALANERSASAPTLVWNGVEVNHQFSKSRRAERLLADAVGEIDGAPRIFSLLRAASELSIARAFATRMPQYHQAFTSCNRLFRIDPARRPSSWCCDCDKCRFVFLILAPFTTPSHMTEIFGSDLLQDADQYDRFALLMATDGSKPFECVGEVGECLAAIRLLDEHPQWRDHTVVRRLVAEVLSVQPVSDSELQAQFELSADHDVPRVLIGSVSEVLGA